MASLTGGEDALTVPLGKLLGNLNLSEPKTTYDHVESE